MEVKLVTGYIPLQGHPRTAKEYGELGENLFGKLDCKNFSIHPFYEQVTDTWLSRLISHQPYDVTHSVADNPAKNTLAYHCVQHQKFGWLLKAMLADPAPKTFVWMDYGIGHVPGVTPAVVQDFMDNVKPNDFAIPGCWDAEHTILNDLFPCWRWCGGLMVVPRNKVYQLFKMIKYTAAQRLQKTRNVTWEVNTLTHAEPGLPTIRWYYADHNATLFKNYAKDAPNGQSNSGDSVRPVEGPAPVTGEV